jgi:hypothetical protein
MPDFPDIPRHIAVIMDGNGRWAKERGLPRREGHRAGAESVREVTDACIDLGVDYLTLYAFSSENWNRPEAEVRALMELLDRFLSEKATDLKKQNIRLKTIGQIERLPAKTRKLLDRLIEETRDHTALTLVLALSYGARGNRGRRPFACRRYRGRKNQPGANRLHILCTASANRRHPGSRSARPHIRGDAGLEFPAVADQLCRDRDRQEILAGLPTAGPARRGGRIPAPPPQVRGAVGVPPC